MKAVAYIVTEFEDGLVSTGAHVYVHDNTPLTKGIGKGATFSGPNGYYEAPKKDNFTKSVTPLAYLRISRAYPAKPTRNEWLTTKVNEQNTLSTEVLVDSIPKFLESLPKTITIDDKTHPIEDYTLVYSDKTGFLKEVYNQAPQYYQPEDKFTYQLARESFKYNEKCVGYKEALRSLQIAQVIGNNGWRLEKDVSLECVKQYSGVGFHSTKTTPRHPMYCSTYLYSETLKAPQDDSGNYVYCMGKHERKGDKDRDLAGKKDSGYYYSILLSKEPIAEFDELYALQSEMNITEVTNNLVAFNISNMYGSRFYQDFREAPKTVATVLRTPDSSTNLTNFKGDIISLEFKTPKLSFNLKDDTRYLYDILKLHRGEIDHVRHVVADEVIEIKSLSKCDITETFYDTTPKGLKLKSSITAATRYVEAKLNMASGTKRKVKLEPSVYMPDRNAMSRLAEYNPKITFVSWMECDLLCRFAVIIETEDTVSIYAPIYRNYHLIL